VQADGYEDVTPSIRGLEPKVLLPAVPVVAVEVDQLVLEALALKRGVGLDAVTVLLEIAHAQNDPAIAVR
jgi:hypothetical protein